MKLIYTTIVSTFLFFGLNSCLKEHNEIIPKIEGVPAGGMRSLQVTKVEGDLIELELSLFVVDHFGGFIKGLSSDNFKIKNQQSGQEITITGLREEQSEPKGPFSASLLFDQSGSINTTDTSNDRIKAGTGFAEIIGNGDEACVAAFSSGGYYQTPYELLAPFSDNPYNLIPAIENLLGKADGGTPLYQSIYGLIPYTADNSKNLNRAIVAFTDGVDTDGGVSINDIISSACSNKVQIFTIGLSEGVDDGVLSKLAFETGGAVMLAQDALQLVSLYNSLGDLLHSNARFYHLQMKVKRSSGSWNAGNTIAGEIELFLSEGWKIIYPFSIKLSQSDLGEWYEKLPACPCTYEEAKDVLASVCTGGEWINCNKNTLLPNYHYGATYEVRWVPNISEKPGQQCTYDSQGKLITSGIAAGSPDKDSPDICGIGDIINESTFPDPGHYLKDVIPWGGALGISGIPCWEYLQKWPSNNENGCPENSVTDIQHMLLMLVDMDCEEVTSLFKIADNTSSINPDLRNYIHGTLNYTPSNLIELLTQLESIADCNEFDCDVIQTAIENLQ